MSVLPRPELPSLHPLNLPLRPPPSAIPAEDLTLGWGTALAASRVLRGVGGVVTITRHRSPDPDDPIACWSLTWYYRGTRRSWHNATAWYVWIHHTLGDPYPSWLAARSDFAAAAALLDT